MNSRISVIIPVYNVEKYLPECLNSVLRQTYSNLEILLINDGSTDNSGRICDSFAKRDFRIKVFHQLNSGAGAAKNVGLKNATGQYFAFVDSDDYLEEEAFEYMLTRMIEEGADVIQCGYRDVYKNKQDNNDTINKRSCIGACEFLRLYTSDWTAALLWDKLYKRELFDGIFFETGHIVDDEFFTYRGIINARKIVRDPKVVYNYRKRRSSVTLRPEHGERIISDKLDYLIPRRERIIERFPELKKDFDKNLLYMLIWLSKDPFITENNIERIKKIICRYILSTAFCGAELNVYFRLIRMLFVPNAAIVSQRNAFVDSLGIESCFE